MRSSADAKKSAPNSWVITRSRANPAVAQGWHIQVQTADTFAGFAVVPGLIPIKDEVIIQRGKTSNNKWDTFSLNLGNAITFTLVGKIVYRGDWNGIP
jgi:hypothetical protein